MSGSGKTPVSFVFAARGDYRKGRAHAAILP